MSSTVGEGVRSAHTLSAADGSFRFSSMAPGAYFIAPRTEMDGALGARFWRTGDRDIRLVVERWWLEVAVGDPGAGRVFCAGLYNGRAGRAIEPIPSGDTPGSVVFPVGGGRRYLYGLVDDHRGVMESTVLIPWDDYRVRRSVSLEASDLPGAIDLEMLTLDSEDKRRARNVSIHSTESGFELWSWQQREESSQRVLPCGEYFLRIMLQPTHSYRDGSPGFETLLVAEQVLRIRPNETTRLELWR